MTRVPERGNPAPFAFQRGPVGCLLIHGFPGSPAEMRPLGESLAERNVSILAPLLPGFGTIPEDLRGIRWRDWAAAADAGTLHLRRSCSAIFVCGLSMGGALALYLAAHVPLPLAGVIALAPAIRPWDRRIEWVHLMRPFRAWREPRLGPDDLADPQNRALTWHYRRYPSEALVQLRDLIRAARRSVPNVHIPTLIVQSPRDSALNPEGARWVHQQIPAADKTLIWLERSGHNIAVDLEREEVFDQVYSFITRVAGTAPQEAGAA